MNQSDQEASAYKSIIAIFLGLYELVKFGSFVGVVLLINYATSQLALSYTLTVLASAFVIYLVSLFWERL